jgi:hypothetical protein
MVFFATLTTVTDQSIPPPTLSPPDPYHPPINLLIIPTIIPKSIFHLSSPDLKVIEIVNSNVVPVSFGKGKCTVGLHLGKKLCHKNESRNG